MELVCVFLPQTELFVPFAAFFVAVCLVLCIFDAARKAALCILLGAAVGMASVLHTANRLERIRVQYAGRPLVLTAEVESTADSYDPGIVDAVLHVEKVNGSAASFRVECSALPECKAGERVQGRFILSAPASGSRVSLYADGIALQAEMDEDGPELTVLGESGSFRARTHRLQQRLSASLRRRMDGKTGGVLAAMTTGDRSYLSSAMRSAYRGAGLAHVLVVSGMHVSILCGDILSTLLPYEWEQSYRRRRCRAVFRSLLAFLLMGVTGLLDRWAVWISAKPGVGIYFDTAYAAIVCLVLILLGWLAFHWRVRLRVAGPCILLAAAVSIGLGNALSRDVVHIDLVGSANAPAVVVTQNDTAVVLFRGGASAQNAVENQLARRGVQTVELVADLRTNPKTACTLEAERTLPAAEMAVNTAQKLRCTPALVEMLRTRKGCLVRLTVGNRQFAVVNGTVELAKQVTVQWLLASPAKPDAVQYKNVLALRSYDWMDNRKELAASISLRRHGGLKTE